MSNTYFTQLRSHQPSTLAEDWLIDNVCSNVPTALVNLAREFFLGEYSFSFLSYLGKHLFGTGANEIMGEYYEFISPRGGANNTPYYKVKCFNRRKQSKLKSYVATITARYFTQLRKREIAKEQNEISIDAGNELHNTKSPSEVIENEWFNLLIAEGNQLSYVVNDQHLIMKVNTALQKLPKNERRVVQLTIMDTVPSDEVFDELYDDMKAQKAYSEFTKLEKQRAIGVLRNRALAHLRKYMKE